MSSFKTEGFDIKFEGIDLTHDQLLQKLTTEKDVAFRYQQRRHQQWNETYQLYRDVVLTNRLTQRQSVNVPLMKETIRTLFTKIDDEMDIYFEDLSGNPDKEIIVKELWRSDFDDNNLSLIDAVDKKTVLLYGRSHIKLNWVKKHFEAEVKDIFDVLVDPKTSPLDIETARFIVEQNIFKSLKWIVANKSYNAVALQKLSNLFKDQQSSQHGSLIQGGVRKEIDARNDRLHTMGATNTDEFGAADVVVQLAQHYTEIWNKDKEEFERWVCVVADGKLVISAQRLTDALGVTFWPFTTWASDLEGVDYWSDGEGDTLRVPNKIINIWMSQYLENRTLRNYGMNVYDATIEGFVPPTWDPKPGAWFGVPGKVSEVFQRLDIPELGGTLDDISFVTGMAERAVAATAMDKGDIADRKRTLGEIEIAVSKSMERTSTLSKFYRKAHKEFGTKWLAILDANTTQDEKRALYKKAPNGKIIGKEVSKKDWKSKAGYKVKALNQNEQMSEKTDELNRLFAIQGQFQNNAPLQKAIKRRALQIANLDVNEIDEILAADEMAYSQQEGMDENGLLETANLGAVLPPQAGAQARPGGGQPAPAQPVA